MIRYAKPMDSELAFGQVSGWLWYVCESMVWPLAFWYVSDEIYGVVVTIGCDELGIPGRYCCHWDSFPYSAAVDLNNETIWGGGRKFSACVQRSSWILPE